MDTFVYIFGAETGILHTVIVHISASILDNLERELLKFFTPKLGCIQESSQGKDLVSPDWVKSLQMDAVRSKFYMWRVLITHVTNKWPLQPFHSLRQGTKVHYSKTKGNVDGASQLKSILRPVGSLEVKRKIVTQGWKALAVDAF